MTDVAIEYWVTHDGGATWKPVRLAGPLDDVLLMDGIIWDRED